MYVSCILSVSTHYFLLGINNGSTLYFKWAVFVYFQCKYTLVPVAQMVEHGASNAKIMGSIPRESKS